MFEGLKLIMNSSAFQKKSPGHNDSFVRELIKLYSQSKNLSVNY